MGVPFRNGERNGNAMNIMNLLAAIPVAAALIALIELVRRACRRYLAKSAGKKRVNSFAGG